MAGRPVTRLQVLRVNTTPSFAQELIAPMLAMLIERHPHLRVELETDPRTIDMMQEWGASLNGWMAHAAIEPTILKSLGSVQV
jgi:DNA-binding transcriptional LysR family regulator